MRASLFTKLGEEKPLKIKRHNPVDAGFSERVQIIRKLRTAEQLLDQGQTVVDVCKALEVSALSGFISSYE